MHACIPVGPALLALLVGCGDTGSTSSGSDGGANGDSSIGGAGFTGYNFESQFALGENSVSYAGQTARQVLIADIKTFIGELTERIDSGTLTAAEVPSALDFYFRFDSDTAGDQTFKLSTDPAPTQATYADISSGKDLVGKLAGNDFDSPFSGWAGVSSSQELLDAFFQALAHSAKARENGERSDLPIHVSDAGQDLQQLTEKFLLGAVNFSQGVDDYLDEGLSAPHTQEEGKNYTTLEHKWDEAFGYFGAARDYGDYTDEELASKGGRSDYQGYHDTDRDGAIDLKSEYNFGASLNAAKRDLGSAADAKTDFSKQAFDAFVSGRRLLAETKGELSDPRMRELEGYRDSAVAAWDTAIAATAVHYVNDVLKDVAEFGAEGFSFIAYAKHWSELKGFALSFQFNPRSPLSHENFVLLHTLLGDSPVAPDAPDDNVMAYKKALLQARALLGTAYNFAPENLGNEDGENGW